MCKNTTPHQRSVGSCIFIAKIIKNRTIDEVISKSQGLNGVYPKIDVPPLSLSGFSPTTQIGQFSTRLSVVRGGDSRHSHR